MTLEQVCFVSFFHCFKNDVTKQVVSNRDKMSWRHSLKNEDPGHDIKKNVFYY